MSADCIFCKIAAGEIPANIVDSNDHVVAFEDLNPAAPTHVLVIPRDHVSGIGEVASDAIWVGPLIAMATSIAKQRSLDRGYRLVLNQGSDGGQSVFHVHLHLLGGRTMAWPPG